MFGKKSPTPRSLLLSPLEVGQLKLPNRVVVSPMCMYSAVNGLANDFHLVHLGGFALGGAGLIFTEATAVAPEGRISPEDLGLWQDEQIAPLARVVDFVHQYGSCIGAQLAHAGRKASTLSPLKGRGVVAAEAGGWEVLGPDTQAYSPNSAAPRAMSTEDLAAVVLAFKDAARRAMIAGFDTVEIHAAHGYLLHEFLSPLSNSRADLYGGPLENRARLLLEVVDAVRGVWPAHLPIAVRLSATDWATGGWDIEETVQLCHWLERAGVQLIDVSSGGLTPAQHIPVGPAYQVPFAERIKRETGLTVIAVGLITDAKQAEMILRDDKADLVAFGRLMLRDPRFAQRAAQELGDVLAFPGQYERAVVSS